MAGNEEGALQMRQPEAPLVLLWMEEGDFGCGVHRAQLPWEKNVEPKPKENLLSWCQKALLHPLCGDVLLPVLLQRGGPCEIPCGTADARALGEDC